MLGSDFPNTFKDFSLVLVGFNFFRPNLDSSFKKKNLFIIFYLLFCVGRLKCHGVNLEVRGQFLRVGYPYGSRIRLTSSPPPSLSLEKPSLLVYFQNLVQNTLLVARVHSPYIQSL